MIKEALTDDASVVETAALNRQNMEEIYWASVIGAINPSLTSTEADDIGRAVLKYSGEYGLSPRLIVAVIKVESSGRVSAVSPKGAEGLMQVMPFWKKELGIEGTLFDIDTNIGAGSHILAHYINRYGFEEGIARYYRGTLPVSGDAYIGKVQKAMESIG
ncbi:MAG: transglycosylase SLT domain-containing protein [Deltaproteobacteria bacterium]|nr:transglycosylase SLT domain-containing protein [Deltaproteobacteria bacterium]MCL4874234.1 transglycosylase SLT domain-containing protein [bacterium]